MLRLIKNLLSSNASSTATDTGTAIIADPRIVTATELSELSQYHSSWGSNAEWRADYRLPACLHTKEGWELNIAKVAPYIGSSFLAGKSLPKDLAVLAANYSPAQIIWATGEVTQNQLDGQDWLQCLGIADRSNAAIRGTLSEARLVRLAELGISGTILERVIAAGTYEDAALEKVLKALKGSNPGAYFETYQKDVSVLKMMSK
jgi:hypothetical protein